MQHTITTLIAVTGLLVLAGCGRESRAAEITTHTVETLTSGAAVMSVVGTDDRALRERVRKRSALAQRITEAGSRRGSEWPDLSKLESARLDAALSSPQQLWTFLTAPDTPYGERLEAARRGASIFPIDWLPRLLEVRRATTGNWGLLPHPHDNRPHFYWMHDQTNQTSRTVLGHVWTQPSDWQDYPLTWEEEQASPWPWQVHQAVEKLYIGLWSTVGQEPATAQHWIDTALGMPCETEEETYGFLDATDRIDITTSRVLARWYAIALDSTARNAAAHAATDWANRVRRWADPQALAVGQVLILDVLTSCTDNNTRARAACEAPRLRDAWSRAGGVSRRPMPASTVLALARHATDPAKGESNWDRLYVYGRSAYRCLDNPPKEPDWWSVKPGSEEARRLLADFAKWFEQHRAELEAAAAREAPELERARIMLQSATRP